MKWLSRLIVLGAFAVLLFPALMSISSVSAELSEAEKQAIEQAREAEKQAAEDQQNQQAPEPPQADEPAPPPEAPEPPPPDEPAPQEDVELTEAEKQAIEAAKKAAEDQQGGQDQGGNVATDRLNGHISAFGSDFLTVGIIGNNTFTVTNRTYITYNGQAWTLRWGAFIGDTVSVQFDSVTNEALRIEIEGYGFSAIYQDVGVEITYIGWIGHWPYDFGMHAGGAGLKLGAATQVTINGVPAAYSDLQVGDTIDYVMSAINLQALWIIVTR